VQVHAVGIVVVPLIGTIVALLFARTNGVGAMEVALLIAFYTLSILGITVGFHRHFAHRAFATSRGVRFCLGVLGSLAAQGPLTYWVSNHRRHHRFSDREGDPHSPHVAGTRVQRGLRGFLHAHMGWTLYDEVTNTAAFSPDLLRDPLDVALNRTLRVHYWVCCFRRASAAF
jgi:stearoyl-CoA desaturase (delta-9 desaturase)